MMPTLRIADENTMIKSAQALIEESERHFRIQGSNDPRGKQLYRLGTKLYAVVDLYIAARRSEAKHARRLRFIDRFGLEDK